jgi:hypothetical protein
MSAGAHRGSLLTVFTLSLFTPLFQPVKSVRIIGGLVRSVEEYLSKADEFDALAAAEKNERLKRRYADVAECFRLLAKERARLIGDGDLAPDTQPRAH